MIAMTRYVIRQTRSFYGPRKVGSLVDRGDGTPITFPAVAAAQEWITEHDAAVYYQAWNEYGRPEYKIVLASTVIMP